MKTSIIALFLFIISGTITSEAQTYRAEPTPTPVKVVVTDNLPAPTVTKPEAKTSEAPIIIKSAPRETPRTDDMDEPRTRPRQIPNQAGDKVLSFNQIKRKLSEAKRSMQTRTVATSLGDPSTQYDYVRVAFHDWRTDRTDYFVMSKESFLSTVASQGVVSENGRQLLVKTIRGNGVNTPITITDERGQNHQPLMVQYPVVRGGKYIETAYYMSTHPGLVTPEVVSAGQFYVRNVIDLAREKLQQRGIFIQKEIVDVAERLATVEHVDHLRFRTEPHINIYNDVFTLFALNEGQTYRYSVSSAGAGGMVQMIPSTYRMVRSWHPTLPLNPDFVAGMQDHVNASQAMLLYIQRTWNDLIVREAVRNALASGIATQTQLLAAGYNSNPARLSGYITRGGAGWTNLIPRETKIYLQIYDSLERNVPMRPRTR